MSPFPIIVTIREKWKSIDHLRKSEDNDMDALQVRSIKNFLNPY